MEIRKKLTLRFTGLTAVLLALSSLSIYIAFSQYRLNEFYDRMERKSRAVAQMLIDIDEVDAELLAKIEENSPTSLPNEEIIIFNYNNEVLFSSKPETNIEYDNELLNKIRLEGSVKARQPRYEILGLFYTGKYDRFVVLAAATDIFGLQKLKNLQLILLLVFCAGLFFTYLAGKLFAGKALKPIARVVDQVNQIGGNNLNARVDEGNGKDEIARLSGTFNRMLSRLESAFNIQKNFIANASHELRTPMTAIAGQLEVTLMKKRTNEEYMAICSSVLDDVKSLSQMTNKLLLLAQASNDLLKGEFKPVRIDDLIWQARTELLRRREVYRIEIQFARDLDEEDCFIVDGNESLLRTAILNLMDNGCKYSPDHSVKLSVTYNESKLLLSFADSGVGVSKEEKNLIFQPFYRAKNAIGQKGHGIGLSLVERIIKLHRGGISVDSVVNQGSVFTIILQVAKGQN